MLRGKPTTDEKWQKKTEFANWPKCDIKKLVEDVRGGGWQDSVVVVSDQSRRVFPQQQRTQNIAPLSS